MLLWPWSERPQPGPPPKAGAGNSAKPVLLLWAGGAGGRRAVHELLPARAVFGAFLRRQPRVGSRARRPGLPRLPGATLSKCSPPSPRRPHPAGDAVRRLPCPGAPAPDPGALAAGHPGRALARMASRCGRAAPGFPSKCPREYWRQGGKCCRIDRPILGRAIDHLKSDHQVEGSSQDLAGQSPVQPANSSDFEALTLWISVRTNWTG